jgi:predicted SAM-dependent methyltransferase
MIATAVRLDIGAGTDPHGPGWTTVDAYTGADVKAQMWALPFHDGAVDEIWSSHALEHVALADIAPTLSEWFRVLRPGGKATIQVPDLDYAARYWLDHPGEPWALALLFGNQAHPGEFHRTGWNLSTFRADLLTAGFRIDVLSTVWDYDQETVRAEVTRPHTRPDWEVLPNGTVDNEGVRGTP